MGGEFISILYLPYISNLLNSQNKSRFEPNIVYKGPRTNNNGCFAVTPSNSRNLLAVFQLKLFRSQNTPIAAACVVVEQSHSVVVKISKT